MNSIAAELNGTITAANPRLFDMLSMMGKNLFFPKGILSQGAEAKQKAYRMNATIGIATERGGTMFLDSVMDTIHNIPPEEVLPYAPSFGLPELRNIWKTAMIAKNPSLQGKPTSLPVVTCGITHGISTVADVWVDPGDVILLPEMMWGNYRMIFSIRRGADIVNYQTFTETGGFNTDALEKTLTQVAGQKKKIIVLLNFPHNPSGYTITAKEGERIIRTLAAAAEAGTNIIAVTDDSYFGLFYEKDILKESLFAQLCDIHPGLLAVKLDGATKENFVWGLRTGFITYGIPMTGDPAPVYDALERKTAGDIRGNISNAARLSQAIVLQSMQNDHFTREKNDKFNILKSRAVKVKTVLADEKYKEAWDVYPFNSGYFMCLKLKTVDAERLRVHLLDKYGVGLIALGKTDLRVAFSCLEEDEIQELFDTVLKGIQDLSS